MTFKYKTGCSCNREHILGVGEASCYYCLEYFPANEITEWVDNHLTAVCPRCGIDSVSAGKVDLKTLKKWHQDMFGVTIGE